MLTSPVVVSFVIFTLLSTLHLNPALSRMSGFLSAAGYIIASLYVFIVFPEVASNDPAEIQRYFVQRYGEWILLSPPRRGFNLLVWLLPLVFVTAGLVVVIAALGGLVLLPSLQQAVAFGSLWDAICSAAGVVRNAPAGETEAPAAPVSRFWPSFCRVSPSQRLRASKRRSVSR